MLATEKNAEAIERARTFQNVPWCEEYELMISGMPYRSWESPTLDKARIRASKILREYNQIDPYGESSDRAEVLRKRGETLKSLFGEIRGNVLPNIDPHFFVLYGCNTSIGEHFYGNAGITLDDSALITIGNNVSIGPGVQLITINHPTDVELRLTGVMYARPITIGDACWIGSRATILPGATIGQGCTIGACAVVSGCIPEYSVAVGNPARVVKRVFPVGRGVETVAESGEGVEGRVLDRK